MTGGGFTCRTNPMLLAPDNAAILTRMAAEDFKRELVGNTYGGRHFKRCPDRGDVSNGAIDSAAIELNRSGLENPLPYCCAPLFHSASVS